MTIQDPKLVDTHTRNFVYFFLFLYQKTKVVYHSQDIRWLNLKSVHVGPPGCQNVQTRNEAYGDKIFYLLMAPSCGQFKWCLLMVKFRTDPSGTTCHQRDYSMFWVWQCFNYKTGTTFPSQGERERPQENSRKWKISATDQRKWNPIFAREAFLESTNM